MDNKHLSAVNFSPTVVAAIKHWILTKQRPPYIVTAEQIQKWDSTFRGFRVQGNDLMSGNRVVIEDDPTEIRDAIGTVYRHDPAALGKGINLFWTYVQGRYIGVNRQQVTSFLKRQPEYQMGASHAKIESRGLQVTAPFQSWACDLVDMGFYSRIAANRHYHFILSIIDLFSCYVWLVPLN